MKHILKFILQTLIVLFVFYPIVISRWIWTSKWNDKIDGLNRGVSKLIPYSWRTMVRNIQGLPTWSTY